MKLLRNRDGVTLMEVIVVLVILGILLAVGIPSLFGMVEHTRKMNYEIEANKVFQTLQMYVTLQGETEIDQLELYEEMTTKNVSDSTHPLYNYLTTSCTEGAQIIGIVVNSKEGTIVSMTYKIDEHVIKVD